MPQNVVSDRGDLMANDWIFVLDPAKVKVLMLFLQNAAFNLFPSSKIGKTFDPCSTISDLFSVV